MLYWLIDLTEQPRFHLFPYLKGGNSIYPSSSDGQASSSAIMNSNDPNRAKNCRSNSLLTMDHQPSRHLSPPTTLLSTAIDYQPTSQLISYILIILLFLLYWKYRVSKSYLSLKSTGLVMSDVAASMGDNVSWVSTYSCYQSKLFIMILTINLFMLLTFYCFSFK